jgi:hypothetical protein
LSERFDDAAIEVPMRVLQHAESCRECQRFVAAAHRVRAVLRTDLADPLPVAAPPEPRPRRAPARIAVGASLAAALIAIALIANRDEARVPIDTLSDEFPAVADGERALLVWTSGGLPDRLASEVAALDGVQSVAEVRGDQQQLAVAGGWVDLDVLAVDPTTYANFVPEPDRATIESLDASEAILGETSARLRGLEVGDSVGLDGRYLRIVRILDDRWIGAAEVVVAHGALPDVRTPRYLLVAYRGDRAAITDAIRLTVPDERGVRFRGAGEARILRHGDAVLPQAWVKQRFGEFVDDGRSAVLHVDDGFVREHIARYEIPVFGEVQCHRALEDPLRAAAAALDTPSRSLLSETTLSCFAPARSSVGGGPARSSWGISVALSGPVLDKAGAMLDPAIVEVFETAGFVWGGDWLDRQPNRFEYVGA